MGCHLIGIGGTGAKTVEAVTTLCAAGLGPPDLSVMFLDPDTANGNIERSSQVFGAYGKCREAADGLSWGETTLLRTVLSGGDVVTPFRDELAPTLSEWLKYDTLRVEQPAVANLLEVLYTEQERETKLEKGFRGHPSIGSAIMAGQMGFQTTPEFQRLQEQVQQDIGNGHSSTIVLVGSIFGGTGAAGFPTVARMLREEFADHAGGAVRIGGVLILPYFSFAPEGQRDEMAAKSSEFLLSTQAALEFYDQSEYQDHYDQLYVIGDTDQSQVESYAIGASEQKNDPHFIELYGALAAIDFLTGTAQGPADKVAMVARHDPARIEWTDLPGGSQAKQSLGQLVRFAVAFTKFYHPLIQDIRQRGNAYRAPWFHDLITKASVNSDDQDTTDLLDRLNTVCEHTLDWTRRLQGSSGEHRVVELFDDTTFFAKSENADDFDPRRFAELVRPEKSDRHTMDGVWEALCASKYQPTKTGANGIGVFLRALYDVCGASD